MTKPHAYSYIRQKILHGELKPGDQISARAIAKEVGTSFIPVREALVRLAADGLVTHTLGVGSFVAAPDRQDLLDMYQFRELLEGFAAEQAVRPEAINVLADMRQANAEMRSVLAEITPGQSSEWTPDQVERWMDGDRAFHRALLRAGGNRVMIDAADRLMTRGPMLAWTWRLKTSAAAQQTCDEHDHIINALDRHDGASVKAAVLAHLRRGRDEAVKGFEAHRLKSTRDLR